jgi:predicted RecB family nuclease
VSKITYNVTDNGKLPPAAKISELRFNAAAWSYRGEWRGLRGEVVRNLHAEGITTIADLENHSIATLKAIPGVGQDTAAKLVKVAKMADIKYRGTDWPWEVEVKIQVPSELVKHVGNLPKGEVQLAVAEHISSELWDKIDAIIIKRRKEQLQLKLAKLQEELNSIEGGKT